jgi:Xaa-Pro aminopeptidase
LEANIEGIKAVKAGVSAGSIDAVCRDYLKSLEYDKFFIHGTGHGVGVDIHEAPTLNALSNEVLRRNMVVTVEPGVYIPGFGGVRVEDLLIVTQNGSTVISHTDKKLLIL